MTNYLAKHTYVSDKKIDIETFTVFEVQVFKY